MLWKSFVVSGWILSWSCSLALDNQECRPSRFINDPSADLTPFRALDELGQCSKPLLVEHSVSMHSFEPSRNQVYIALNGEATGAIVQVEDVRCLATLAEFAYRALVPNKTESQVRGPKFLFSLSGLPIRNSSDVELRGNFQLHVLSSKETWVWPFYGIRYEFEIEGFKLVTISDRPRVFSIANLLDDKTCDKWISMYENRLEPSPEKHYSDEFKDHRTSLTGWMSDSYVRYYLHRILRLPELAFVEQLQFLKYSPGKWYKYHHDYFHDFREVSLLQYRRWLRERILSILEYRESDMSSDPQKAEMQSMLIGVKNKLQSVITTPLQNSNYRTQSRLGVNVTSLVAYVLNPNIKVFPPNLLVHSSGLCQEIPHCSSSSFLSFMLNSPDQDALLSRLARHFPTILAHELGVSSEVARKCFSYPDELESMADELGTESMTSQVELNRHATVLPYLNHVEKGGETVFPNALFPERYLGEDFEYPNYEGIPECSRGLLVRPHKGAASLFYHRLPNGDKDELSLHAGCPPVVGTKYAVNGFTWNCSPSFGTLYFG